MHYVKKLRIRPRRFELLQISHQEIILPLNHDLKFVRMPFLKKFFNLSAYARKNTKARQADRA